MLSAGIRTLVMVFLVALAVNADAAEERAHFMKDNALSLKAGYRIHPGSDFVDFWNIDRADFNSFIGEVAYERRLYKHLWLEIAAGYCQSGEEYAGTRVAGDFMDLTIVNAYLSPTLKIVVPLSDFFTLYGGGRGRLLLHRKQATVHVGGIDLRPGREVQPFRCARAAGDRILHHAEARGFRFLGRAGGDLLRIQVHVASGEGFR